MARDVQLEENLPGTFAVFVQLILQMRNNKMFDFWNEGQCDGTAAMALSIKDIVHVFTLAFRDISV